MSLLKYIFFVGLVILLLNSLGCKASLGIGGNKCVPVTVAQAQAQIQEGEEFIIFFTQRGCGPCITTKAMLKGDIKVRNLIKNRYGSRLYFIDINNNDPEQQKIVKAAKVTGTPTIVLLKKVDGNYNEVRRVVGSMNRTSAFKFLTGGKSDPNLNPYKKPSGLLQRIRN
jgi:thioredoxin-related protein